MRFEFREGHFDRVEMTRGAIHQDCRQAETGTGNRGVSGPLRRAAGGGRRLDFVGGQIVEDDNGARIEGRSRLGFDTGVECRAVDGPGDDPGRDQCVCVSPAMNVCVPHLPNGATP